MNPIDELFRSLKDKNCKAFIPFMTAGDPDLAFTERILPAMAKAGADLIEVGFPYSDPIADGPVIQASYTRALDHGLKLDQIFESIRTVTSGSHWDTPLVAMTSYSLILRRGGISFIRDAKNAGFSGAVVPDLPGDEAEDFAHFAAEENFKLILLVTPTTPMERAKRILQLCSGFVYCVSIVGITGQRDRIPESLEKQLQELREFTETPLCVGFGISRPEHVRQLRSYVDGVIVGSALVRHLEKAKDNPAEAEKLICQQIQELTKECILD